MSPPRNRVPLRGRYLHHVHRLIHSPGRRLRDPQVSHYRLALERWPRGLAGLRVVQLSDIHYSLYLHEGAVARAVELANRLRPDLIALTGDFVTASRQFVEPVGELLGSLHAPLGVYAVLGNHDFRVGAELVTRALARRNIRVLRNMNRPLQLPGGRLKIVGIDDSRQRPDLRRALGPHDPRAFTLLLAHNPIALAEAAAEGIDLVLSGHTHGGQVRLGFAAPLFERHFPDGFCTLASTRMYISRGLGQVIFPWRIGCPAEVAAFSLYPQ